MSDKKINQIKINGVTIVSNSNSITISNGKIKINNEDYTPEDKDIKIEVIGNIEKIEADVVSKIIVSGDVRNIQTQSGDVEVHGSINGNVSTMSGDVECVDQINGNISTISGDVILRKT